LKKSGSYSMAAIEYMISLAHRFVEYLISIVSRTWNALIGTFTNGDLILSLFLSGAIIFVGWICFNWVRSDGRVDYCYVDKTQGVIELVGHRSFRPNADLRILKDGETVQVLYDQAKTIGCPIK
jgi:hypothetical protein